MASFTYLCVWPTKTNLNESAALYDYFFLTGLMIRFFFLFLKIGGNWLNLLMSLTASEVNTLLYIYETTCMCVVYCITRMEQRSFNVKPNTTNDSTCQNNNSNRLLLHGPTDKIYRPLSFVFFPGQYFSLFVRYSPKRTLRNGLIWRRTWVKFNQVYFGCSSGVLIHREVVGGG